MDYLEVIFWSAIGSVVSLAGGLLIIGNGNLRRLAVRYGLPFGAGALLAAAFVGVFPKAVEGSGIESAAIYALLGFLTFFLMERLLGWFHHHEPLQHGNFSDNDNATHQWLVILGDTMHNAIDGVAIGAAFLIDPSIGIATALAVAAHEIPQEIGDFGILLGRGMRPRSVVIVNVLSGMATVLLATLTYMLGLSYDINPAPLLALAAGFFIYIAASDIIPDIHEQSRSEGNRQSIILLAGVAIIAFAILSMPHSHNEQENCVSRATLDAMGAPAPGHELPPVCE